ncbi:Transcriptional activator flo8 [Tulasnella sp. 418]|nr:Transcriptional activator flo8 [Tulasnella sp. 418]
MSQMAHPPQHPPQQHLPPGMSHPPPLGAPMMTAPSGSSGHPSNQSSPTLHNRSDSWEGDKMLHVYMLDYCRKRGFTAVVNALCSQTGTVPDAKAPIDAPQGLLYEWWVVFWDIFTAKISENGGSRDAITFHQYQGLHKDQVRHAHFAKQGGAAGAAGGPPPPPGGGPPPPPGAPGPSGLQFTSPHANGIQPPPQHGAQQPFMNGMGHPPPQHPPPPPQSSQQPPPPHHSGPAFHQPQGPGGQQPPPPPHGAQQQQPQQPPHPQPNGPHAPPNGLQQPPPGGQMMNGPPGSQQQQQGPHPPPTIINGPQPYPPQMGHPQQQGPPHPGQHPGMIGGPHGPQPGQQQQSHPGPHHPNQPGQPPHMQGQMHGGPPGQQPQNPNPAMAGGARPQGQPMTTHIAGLQAQAQAQSQALAAAQGRSGHASPFAGGGAPGPSPRMTNMGPPNGIPSTPNMGGPTGAPPPAGGFQRPGSRAETPSTQGGQPSGQQGMMNMSPQRQGSINRPTSGMQGAMGPGGAHPPFQAVPPTMLEQAMRTIGLGGRDPGSLNQDDKIKLNNQIKRMQTGTPRLQSMQANTTGSPGGGSGAGTPPQSFMAPQSGFGNNFGAGPGGGGPPGPGGPGFGGPGFAGGQRPLQEYSQQVVQSMMGVGGKRVGSPMQTDNPPQDSSPPDKKRARRNSNSGMGPAGGMPTGFNPQQPQPGGPPQQPHPMSMQQQPNGTMRPPSIGPTGAQPGQQPQQQQPGGAMMNGVGGPGGMGQGVMSSMSMRNAPPGQQHNNNNNNDIR